MTPEDHPVLDVIAVRLRSAMESERWGRFYADISRESECVEFTDTRDGERYEIVVRRLDKEE